MKKIFDLQEEYIEILHEIMRDNGFATEVQALKYLLKQYVPLQNQISAVDVKLKTIAAVVKEMEFKENMLLDGMNTMMIDQGIKVCKPIGILKSDVLQTSEEYQKEKLADLKQRKDYKKSRCQN